MIKVYSPVGGPEALIWERGEMGKGGMDGAGGGGWSCGSRGLGEQGVRTSEVREYGPECGQCGICGYADADIYTKAERFDPEAPPWSNMRQGFIWRVDE